MTDGPPGQRSFAEQIADERDSRVQEQRRKFEEERRRREAEMARMREEERGRVREAERSRAQQYGFTSLPSPNIDVTTISIETSLLAPAPTHAQSQWALRAPPVAPAPTTLALEPTDQTPPVAMVVRRTDGLANARKSAIAAFLAIDAREMFDIVALNETRLEALVEEASGDQLRLGELAKRAEALEIRARQETATTALVGSFVRDRAVEWFRDSSADIGWRDTRSRRWGGLFAESRVPGGKLQPWIATRLRQLHEESVRVAGWKASFREKLANVRSSKKGEERTRYQVLVTEVAQALLDGMAARPKEDEKPLPLVRLSELAQRWDTDTVNQALADLFGGPERGPFVILHPSRYPDCELVVVRPPPPAAHGGMRSYDLVCAKAGVAATGSITSDPLAPAGGPWDSPTTTEAAWASHLSMLASQKSKLDPPPKDYRSGAAFTALRSLLLRDHDSRISFLAVKWRGRPAGLPLLAQLLEDGMLEPKVSTDYEYIEAELGDIERHDIGYKPADLAWKVPGWKIAREGDFQKGLRYRAEAA